MAAAPLCSQDPQEQPSDLEAETFKDDNSPSSARKRITLVTTWRPFVLQLQAGEGRRVIPGQHRGFLLLLRWFQASTERGTPLEHAILVKSGQRHAFKHTLMKEVLHLSPRRSSACV